jgi:hypothetical protein
VGATPLISKALRPHPAGWLGRRLSAAVRGAFQEARATPGRVGVKHLRSHDLAVADLVDADLRPVRARLNISESAALVVSWDIE